MNQLMVFVFFGQKYLEQFEICLKSIPEKWEVAVITDVKDYGYYIFNDLASVTVFETSTPETIYDMLTFRKRIPEFIDINKYDRIWYSDPDILFTGDILKKYENNENILLAYEPNCSIKHPCMAGGFSEQELDFLDYKKAPCINGGFWSVPKSKYDFFIKYRTLCDFMSSKWPNDHSTDQHVLNNLYHRNIINAELFDCKDVVFRPNETGEAVGLVNHYIGMHSDKVGIMQSELNRIRC